MRESAWGKLKWEKEALQKERVVVRAARASGKTTAAIKWARRAGQNVLFVVPYHTMERQVVMRIGELFAEEVDKVTKYPMKIWFNDGTKITVSSTTNGEDFRGMRMDAVVIDEVGYMNEDQVISVLATAADRPDFRFFMTYSARLRDGVKRVKKMEEVSPVDYITVDYLDLLADGFLLPHDVRTIKSDMNDKTFSEEFGPYDTDQMVIRDGSLKERILGIL